MTPSEPSDFDIAVQRLSRLANNPKTPASVAGDLALVLLAAKAHAAHLAKLDTSGPQWEQPHYCESCDYEWIPGELDQTCKGCGGHGTLGKRPLDTSGLAERIADGVISELTLIHYVSMTSVDRADIAKRIAAELDPVFKELERLKAENQHLQGYRDDFEKRAAWSED